MKTFEYRGFDTAGQSCRGLVEALNPKDAREKLATGGILAERLSPTGRPLRFRAEARANFYRELMALLTAGIPLVRALELLITAARHTTTGTLLAGVRDRVREGRSLADALAAVGASVTKLEHAVIHAGERAGTLATMLGRLADFLDDQEQLRERVRRALIYPSLVVGVGLCVAVVMLGLLVPKTESLLAGSGQSLPMLTQVMLALGRFIIHWGALVVIGAGAAWWGWRRRMSGDEAYRRDWNARLFRLPLLGRGYAQLCSLRFTQTLAILLRGGVSLVDGVSLAGLATGSPWLAQLAAQQSEAVRHGARLSEALGRITPLAGTLPGWVQVGEESGDLAGMLEHAATRTAEHWDRYVSRALALMEPLLILAIGSFVLLITLSVLLPVMTLSRAMSPT
ncbi:MAG: type II secretion system F family protein [Verrucomicrobia bacterium]|nr:type II secretion system F family protein [Verrucomicrobiota bacterium]